MDGLGWELPVLVLVVVVILLLICVFRKKPQKKKENVKKAEVSTTARGEVFESVPLNIHRDSTPRKLRGLGVGEQSASATPEVYVCVCVLFLFPLAATWSPLY